MARRDAPRPRPIRRRSKCSRPSSNLKPKDQWRSGVTIDKLVAEMDAALQFPGVSNAWTMPIRNRIDMLATGIRTPIGVKIIGRDLVADGRAGAPGRDGPEARARRASSAYAERVIGGYYLDIVPDRAALARYGLMIGDVQEIIATALGGETVTTTVEGRERYGVNIRYPRDFRSSPRAIASEVLIAPAGRRHGSARRGREGRTRSRPDLDPHRERPARRLHLRRYPRPRYWRLCRRKRAQAVAEAIEFPPALMSSGAASSNIWSAPRRGCGSSCR